MRLILIRHEETPGNREKRYIGTLDESLTAAGIRNLQRRNYPNVEMVFASPMRRCLETAKMIYPQARLIVCEALREMSFGSFEGKNYQELKEIPAYRRWIDTRGAVAPPGGEVMADFQKRCIRGFEDCLKRLQEAGLESAALVVHGGTIMAILSGLAWPKEDYYHWQAENGGGYLVCPQIRPAEGRLRLTVISTLTEEETWKH